MRRGLTGPSYPPELGPVVVLQLPPNPGGLLCTGAGVIVGLAAVLAAYDSDITFLDGIDTTGSVILPWSPNSGTLNPLWLPAEGVPFDIGLYDVAGPAQTDSGVVYVRLRRS